MDTGSGDTQDLRQERDLEEAKKPFLRVTSPKAFREFLQKETIALCFWNRARKGRDYRGFHTLSSPVKTPHVHESLRDSRRLLHESRKRAWLGGAAAWMDGPGYTVVASRRPVSEEQQLLAG